MYLYLCMYNVYIIYIIGYIWAIQKNQQKQPDCWKKTTEQ